MTHIRNRRSEATTADGDTPEQIEAKYRLLYRLLKRYGAKMDARAEGTLAQEDQADGAGPVPPTTGA
jgi:hypothetical protein